MKTNKQIKKVILDPLNAHHPQRPYFGYFFDQGVGLCECGYAGNPPDDYYEYRKRVNYCKPVSIKAGKEK